MIHPYSRFGIFVCATLIIFLFSGNTAAEVLQSGTPHIYIDPPYRSVSYHNNFTMNVTVDPKGAEIFGAQYNLSFDPAKLIAISQKKGELLSQDGALTVVLSNIDNVNGVLEFTEVRFRTQTGVSNPGTLSSIDFMIRDTAPEGLTGLHLRDVVLTDPVPAIIPDTTVNDSTVDLQKGAPPVAECGTDILRCENVNSTVKFNGSGSYDPDGSIVSYVWDLGDGSSGNGANIEHIYRSYKWDGTKYLAFAVNLTVTDNMGLTNTSSKNVFIWMPGDANGDGRVNIVDASTVGARWNSADACADLNNDGKVNILDAGILGLHWNEKA